MTLTVLMSINQVLSSQVLLVVKNPPTNAEDIRDVGLIPESGGSPGGGDGNPLQYSCLENPMDRGAWWATTCKFAKGWTPLKRLSTQAQSSTSPARCPFIGIFVSVFRDLFIYLFLAVLDLCCCVPDSL